tara:strand:- start:375 stop:560 length:186 start_codon:yes stop_codon:yes gene_type:complete
MKGFLLASQKSTGDQIESTLGQSKTPQPWRGFPVYTKVIKRNIFMHPPAKTVPLQYITKGH